MRAGTLTEPQISMAAYLDYEPATVYLSEGMYDQTGVFNDHVVGICPCGWCRWDEGYRLWLKGLTDRSQNLPFPGIDGPHAEQETLIRTGMALATAVWDKKYTPEQPFGSYAIATSRAERFLEERTEEAREACRQVWTDNHWGDVEWTHSILTTS